MVTFGYIRFLLFKCVLVMIVTEVSQVNKYQLACL